VRAFISLFIPFLAQLVWSSAYNWALTKWSESIIGNQPGLDHMMFMPTLHDMSDVGGLKSLPRVSGTIFKLFNE
jgi:hypothetical protein